MENILDTDQALHYHKVPKFSDTRKLCCNLPENQTMEPNLRVFRQKDAHGIANSEDPDRTAPLGAVWSGSALFAQTCLSENLCSLRYFLFAQPCMSKKIGLLYFSYLVPYFLSEMAL